MKKKMGAFVGVLIVGLAYAFLFLPTHAKAQAFACDPETGPKIIAPLGRGIPVAIKSVTVPQTLAGCVVGASRVYHVSTDVLFGIMYVEAGRMGQEVGPNANGTYDLGIMQINSLWVPKLARLWHVGNKTAYNAVRDGGCENVYVGAWILKQSIAEAGGIYNGIAYYHSATRSLGSRYADKVMATMKRRGLVLSP